MKFRIHIVNGPNLNMLGKREPEIYGHQTLEQINREVMEILARSLEQVLQDPNVDVTFADFQSNHEGTLIDYLQESAFDPERKREDFIIINPGAFAHTSIALRDALLAIKAHVYEVHISNIYQREEFRHHSYLKDIADGIFIGLGTNGYKYAALEVADIINKKACIEQKD